MKAQLKLPLLVGYIAKKAVKDTTYFDRRKYLIVNPEPKSHSAFEFFDYLLTLSV